MPAMMTTHSGRRAIYCALGMAFLSIPALAIAADESFTEQASVPIPATSANTTGGNLTSFDISWVDPTLHAYFLADRSNNAVDIIDTRSKQVTQIGVGYFAGFNKSSDFAGPNGLLTINFNGERNHGDHDHDADGHGKSTQIWVGDGPHSGCTPALATTFSPNCSSTKILSYPSGNLVNVIPTGGVARADELCYDPADHLVMIANDADPIPFVTFISTQGKNRILGQVKFPEAAGTGIEQCQWNARNGMIYLNLPGNGVYVINPRTEKVVNKFADTTGCAPAGMALGPNHQILLGCGGPNSEIISDEDGSILATLTGQGGVDEVWFNTGDGHYFLAEGNNSTPQLGIADSSSKTLDQDIPTGHSSHSVAADPVAMQAYVPITAAGGGSATLCPNSATQGCVAVFGPSSPDDKMVSIYRDHH